MIQIPKLPEKEELEYREKEFLLNVYEQFQGFSKKWLVFLLVVLIAAYPLNLLLKSFLTDLFVNSYTPPAVNDQPYIPRELQVLRTDILPVSANTFSAYAQVLNPNPELSARKFTYRFIFRDRQDTTGREIRGESFITGGESKFLLVPTIALDPNSISVDLMIDSVSWTAWVPPVAAELQILQKNTGLTPEGQFFVEGLVQNTQGFVVKKVDVGLIAFDAANEIIVGINSTAISDLKPFESRYFRAIWPVDFSSIGEVEVIPSVNPFERGLILEQTEDIPVR